jgi:hypothetical protein
MRYLSKSQTVIYRAKMHPVLKRNFEVFPVLDWLAAPTAHIPNQGEHLVRSYGWHSNASRGKRKKAHGQVSAVVPEDIIEVPQPALTRALKQRGAHCVKEVYEADPLRCPRCGAHHPPHLTINLRATMEP